MRKNRFCQFISGGKLPSELNYQPVASELIIDVTSELMTNGLLPNWFNPTYQKVQHVFDFISSGNQQLMTSFGIAFDYPTDVGPRFAVAEVYTLLTKSMHLMGLDVNFHPSNIVSTVEWIDYAVVRGKKKRKRIICYSVLCAKAFFNYNHANSLALYLSDFEWHKHRLYSKSEGIINTIFQTTFDTRLRCTCSFDLQTTEFKPDVS